MSGWNKRDRKMFIPGMESLKTFECKVCGHKFVPKKENKYVVRDRLATGGLNSAMSGQYSESKQYDAFDCDLCGCQMVAKERLRTVDGVN